MDKLKSAYDQITSTRKYKLNLAFKHNGWVIILNYCNGRVETTAHREYDPVEGASWKGFNLSKSTYEDIEQYIHRLTKGEMKRKAVKRNKHILI